VISSKGGSGIVQRPGADHGRGGRRHARWLCLLGLLQGTLGPGDAVRRVAAGDRAIRKLYSKEQRAFYAAHTPEGLAMDDLSVLGPVNVMKLKFTPKGPQPAAGGREVAVPGRGADPGAVD
jgi:hypothetical protein